MQGAVERAYLSNYRKYRWLALGLLAVPLVLVAVVQAASHPPWSALSGGGGSSSSDSFGLDSTLGQGQPIGETSSDNFTLGAGFWYGVSPDPGPPTPTPFIPPPGDLNGDGVVDGDDLRIGAAALGTSPPSDPRADTNGDNVVDILNLVFVALRFGNIA